MTREELDLLALAFLAFAFLVLGHGMGNDERRDARRRNRR